MMKYTIVIAALILSCSMLHGQQQVVENSKSKVVMSEADITSLFKTLKKYKKDGVEDESIESITYDILLNGQVNKLKVDKFEADSLKNQIAPLKTQSNNLSKGQDISVARVESSGSTMNDSELRNLKSEISQLKFAIQQLSRKPNDNVVYVTPEENQASNTYQQPKEVIIREQVPGNNSNDILLRQKLDSLNMLFKNMKQPDSTNYSGDFSALQKRIDAINNEMLAKNSVPSNYDVLVSNYKGYNREIYFADNARVLNTDASEAIEELFAILDNNDNLDVVVKGFASNKGNAIYNENLSLQRTEAVKKALMIRGVHPTRVLTQYHGIDYKAETPAEARRVEISILVRK